jgi:exodeoxyribonuclease V alpha subunit
MSREYDLSDPTDLEMLKSDFDAISADEWQEYIDLTLQDEHKKKFSYDERGCLMIARKKRSTRATLRPSRWFGR